MVSGQERTSSNGDGKLYKLNTATGVWTNVTPVHSKDYSYGGVSIDPTNVNRVIVSSCGMYWNNQSIAYAAGNTNKVVRASNGGSIIYYSNDKGATWTGTATNMGSQGKVAVSADGGTILHCPGGSTTTYYTTNNGGNWSACSGVSFGDAVPVADQVNANYFYIYIRHAWVPLGRNGLKYSTNYGAAYTNVSNVTYCKTIGIGKAVTGASYPTVFIWGTVSGVTGLFRSTDQGVTWSRLNDDAHGFAGAPLLIGDMNVAGRVYMSAGGGRGLIYWDPAACTPTAITPYLNINNGSWQQTANASLAAGGSVQFGPQPTQGGSWSWTGPKNFSAATREIYISNVQSGQAGNYVATYTNSGDAKARRPLTSR